jgi:hypothetical protein
MILHFSHIGLTDGRTFTSLRSRNEVFSLAPVPALATGTVAATAAGGEQRETALQAHPRILATRNRQAAAAG